MIVTRDSSQFIRASLRRSSRLVDGGYEMSYRSISGRDFHLREEADGRYSAYEFTPNGRLCTEHENGRVTYSDWPGHEAAAVDPNGYVEAAAADGVQREQLILVGSGYGVFSRYLNSIEEAAEEFAKALSDNVRYDDQDRLKMNDPAHLSKIRESELRASAEYRAGQARLHDTAVESERGIFKGLYGMMGPLSDGAKQRILSFLNAPSHDTWDDCSRLMVKGGDTMWKLWCDMDPRAPRSLENDTWPRIPEPEVIRQMLRDAGGARPKTQDERRPRI